VNPKLRHAKLQSKMDQDVEGLKDQFVPIMDDIGKLNDSQLFEIALESVAIRIRANGDEGLVRSAKIRRILSAAVSSTITIVRAYDLAAREIENEGTD